MEVLLGKLLQRCDGYGERIVVPVVVWWDASVRSGGLVIAVTPVIVLFGCSGKVRGEKDRKFLENLGLYVLNWEEIMNLYSIGFRSYTI